MRWFTFQQTVSFGLWKGVYLRRRLGNKSPPLFYTREAQLVAARFGAVAPEKDNQHEKASANVQPRYRCVPVVAGYKAVEIVMGKSPAELEALQVITCTKDRSAQQWKHILMPDGSKVFKIWQEWGDVGLITV